MTEAEEIEVAQVLRSGWITTGPRTKEFERQIASYCHTPKVVCLNSATACMEMILRVLGVGQRSLPCGSKISHGRYSAEFFRNGL